MDKENEKNLQAVNSERTEKIMSQYRKHLMACLAIILIEFIFSQYMVDFILDEKLYRTGGMLFWGLLSCILTQFVFVLLIAVLIRGGGYTKIRALLYEECDPFAYETCLSKLHAPLARESGAVLRALAQCCQGNSQKAEETLKNINPYKLRGEDKLEYYLLMSELCFAKGEEMRVAEFERVYLTGVEKNQREQKCFQRFCANNHRLWAMKNKDYPAAHRFLSEQRALSGRKCEKYSVIKYSMLEAEIHAGLGETKSARINLEYVIDEGGRLVQVQQAKELLRKLDEAGEKES